MLFGNDKLLVDVVKHEHANMDSFPFRFGMHFNRTTQLELFNCHSYEWQNFDVKFKVEANFFGKNRQLEKGKFIIMITDHPNPKVVTVIREDIETEIHLSSLLSSMRKANKITPEDLLELHPFYLSGEVNTFDKLAERFYKGGFEKTEKENIEIESIRLEAKNQAKFQYEKIINELKKESERIRNIANQAIKGMDDAAEALGIKEQENERLKAEIIELNNEIKGAKTQGNAVVVGTPLILKKVETNVMYRGSINTILTFDNGSQQTIKVKTFDKDLSVTKKAKSLINCKVKTTSWDPVNSPGKWSSQGYFRQIYQV